MKRTLAAILGLALALSAGAQSRNFQLGKFVEIQNAILKELNRSYVDSLPVERMQKAAEYLQGEHDFKSFCGNPKMKKSTVRNVDMITIKRSKNQIYFTFHGTGFLQHMVRILVGTLLEVGAGRMEPEDMIRILDARDRKAAGPTAPAQGLCMEKVDY